VSCAGRERCSPAQTAAVTVLPGVVFSGAMSGVMRAFDTDTGKVLWEYDTVREYKTVNGAPGRGGAIDQSGVVVVDGWVYMNAGYANWGALPGNVLLVVDQAYAEYLSADADDGALALALSTANVLVTRTFSKIYGLAGERVGWATGAPELIDMLNRIRGPFNLTLTGQAAALAALEDQAFVEASRVHNHAERTRFAAAVAALGNHGLRPLPSEANFVLIEFSGALTAETAYKGLMDHGFITRWLPGQGLPQCLRITIGTTAEIDRVALVLRQLAEAAR
jgi:aspartate/methionine/tyrosine aminotransferase